MEIHPDFLSALMLQNILKFHIFKIAHSKNVFKQLVFFICIKNETFHFPISGYIFEGWASIHSFFSFIHVLLEDKCQCSHFHFLHLLLKAPVGKFCTWISLMVLSFLFPAVTLTVRLAVGDRNFKKEALKKCYSAML